jgi:hypothetical protein
MRSKNHKAITQKESDHMRRVKELPCGVCGIPGPSDCHHIEQQKHFTVIPLCKSCHQSSFNGIHGLARIWAAYKETEMSVLNKTIGILYA